MTKKKTPQDGLLIKEKPVKPEKPDKSSETLVKEDEPEKPDKSSETLVKEDELEKPDKSSETLVKEDEPEKPDKSSETLVKEDEPEKPDKSSETLVKEDEPEKPVEEKSPENDSGDINLETLRKKISEANFKEESKEPPLKKPIVERRKRRTTKAKKKQPDSFFISGYILLTVTDTFIPNGLSLLNNAFNRKLKISGEDLQLTDKQLDQLEPIADQAAEFLAVNINPVAGFFIVSGIFYSSNYLSLISK